MKRTDVMQRMWQALKMACDDPATLAVTVPSIKADMNLLHTCTWRRVEVGEPQYPASEWVITCGEEPAYREEPNDRWEFCPYCGERIEVEW